MPNLADAAAAMPPDRLRQIEVEADELHAEWGRMCHPNYPHDWYSAYRDEVEAAWAAGREARELAEWGQYAGLRPGRRLRLHRDLTPATAIRSQLP